MGLGKERRASIGKKQTFSLDLYMLRADFQEPADSGQAVNAIATQGASPDILWTDPMAVEMDAIGEFLSEFSVAFQQQDSL